MIRFYRSELRRPYQDMLDGQDEADFEGHTPVRAVIKHIVSLSPASVLEVGCSSGRAFRALRNEGFAGRYLGVDLPSDIIADNQCRYADGQFLQASAYDLPAADGSADVCFSMYVLEHLVYPERALSEMMRVVAPTGHLVILFPDFAATKRFPSQFGGLSYGSTRAKLRRGRFIDSLMTAFDYRIRLPHRISRLKAGQFTINTEPACLYFPNDVIPDYDAVYIASKADIAAWAERMGYACSFPCGTEGQFDEHVLASLTKGRDGAHWSAD